MINTFSNKTPINSQFPICVPRHSRAHRKSHRQYRVQHENTCRVSNSTGNRNYWIEIVINCNTILCSTSFNGIMPLWSWAFFLSCCCFFCFLFVFVNTAIKRKHCEKVNIKEETRVGVFSVIPGFEKLCSAHQARSSCQLR